MKLKHNKIKNTAILFEALARQLAADALDNKNVSAASVIIKEFFNKNTQLRKELDLYHSLIKNNFSSEIKASSYIDLIIEARKKLNNSVLKREKYNIVKKIKEHFSVNDLFSSRIENYPIYASVYKIFEYNMLLESNNANDVIESKFKIVEHLIRNPKKSKVKSNISETLSKEKMSVRLLAQKIIVDDFNKNYSSKLNESQKDLIRDYINSISNTKPFSESFHSRLPTISKKLLVLVNKIPDDAIKIKVEEVRKNLNKLNNLKNVKDNHILAMLRTYSLIEEIEAHLKKHECKSSKKII